MKRVSFIVAALLVGSSSSSAGLALFSPQSQEVPLSGEVEMDITLQSQSLANFDSVDVVILSEAPFSFEYSPIIYALSPSITLGMFPLGLEVPGLPHDLYVAAANSAVAGSMGHRILLGTVTIDVVGLDIGEYEVVINSNLDSGISALGRQGVTEPIFGRGVFNIPEPGCALLLLAGVATLASRRNPR